jgi:hypothetical protein
MIRLFVCSAVVWILAGCASNVPEPALQARNDLAAQAAPAAAVAAPAAPVLLPAGAPLTVVDVEDFKNRTFCKNVMKPGTRIVVGKQCTSGNDTRQAREKETMRHQAEASLREQDQITRAARQRDLDYQRPVLAK